MDVSVIYVNWNAEDEILASVRTVRDKIRGVSYEIIVVDNASGNGTAALASEPAIRLIQIRSMPDSVQGATWAPGTARGVISFFSTPTPGWKMMRPPS
jgi:glycosyltransferase involved in cell wall biosynthesis